MKPILAYESRIVEAPLPSLQAIECQTLRAFLHLVRLDYVLVASMERTIAPASVGGAWEKQFAVHLSMRGGDLGRPVCYATFQAATVRGTHTTAQLTYPYEGTPSQGDLASEVRRLIMELHQCLMQVVRPQRSLIGIRPNMRYPLPDAYVWGVRSDASTEGLAFRNGHWIVLPPSSAQPSQ